MNSVIGIDTGPLILLAKIDFLPIAAKLPYRFAVPQEVVEELRAGEEQGHQRVAAPWLAVYSLQSPVPEMIRATLDKGEAAVIQMALENNISRVCIDDLRGRRMAIAVGLDVVGVLGLLGKAKRLGLIAAVEPYINKLIAAGAHYSKDLVAAVIADVDGQ